MERLREKQVRSISLCEGCLDCQCRLGAWSSLRSRCARFPFFLAKRKCQAHMISGLISGWSEAPSEAPTRAQTHSRNVLIPSSPLPTSSVLTGRNSSTTPIPSMTALPTIVSRTTDFDGGHALLSHVRHLFSQYIACDVHWNKD